MNEQENEQEIGARFRALDNGSEPDAPAQLRRFVRDRDFANAAPRRTAAGGPARPNSFRRAVFGIAAAFVLVIGGSGLWLSLHGPFNGANPTASLTTSEMPSATGSAEATGSPSTGPTVSPSAGPTDSPFDPWTTYTFRPSPQSSPVAIAGNATFGVKQRTGTDKATNLQWDFFEPLVTTPGRSAGGRIDSDVEAVLDSRVKELKTDFGASNGGAPEHTVTLITSFHVISSAGPQSDPSAGFVTIRIDYTWNNPPWADAGPQWIDFLSYDLKTGKRISISDLFTNTSTALQRLSAAAAADPVIKEGADPNPQPGSSFATGYESTPANFAMWAPTPTGLEITFAVNQVSAAAAGTPAFTLQWTQLSDLFKPSSYLAWYLAHLSSSAGNPSGPLAHGTFGLTGSMLTSEQAPNVTLLRDGRVLVTGLRAELYDPSTGAFSDTGPLPNARYGRTATLLQDGQVLVAGGSTFAHSEFDASAELYDPRTGKFTATGSMTTPRAYQTATLLEDGRVLIVGGSNTVPVLTADGSTPPAPNLASAELYDPRTGTFTATGSMATGRASHSATLLAGGRVLIVGGRPDQFSYSAGNALASAEIYDPQTGAFSATGSMSTARSAHSATPLSDGEVLITGGSYAPAELYDPATGKFALTASMTTGQVSTLLPDGRVLFVGGGASAQIYDPQTGAVGATGSMVLACYDTSAILLQDGRVLVVGGESTGGASAELYQP